MNVERRTFPIGGLELRADPAGDPSLKHAAGIAARFMSYSESMWGFKERIAPAFFEEALKVSDVRALKNHDPNLVLARHTGAASDTLALEETKEGLAFDATMDTRISYVQDLVLAMERKDITQCSFAFTLPDKGGDRWTKDGDSLVRELVKAERLFDITIATFPAYPDTDASVREMRSLATDLMHRGEPTEDERGALAAIQAEIEKRLTTPTDQKAGAGSKDPEQKLRDTTRLWEIRRTEEMIRYQAGRLGI